MWIDPQKQKGSYPPYMPSFIIDLKEYVIEVYLREMKMRDRNSQELLEKMSRSERDRQDALEYHRQRQRKDAFKKIYDNQKNLNINNSKMKQ